MAGQKKGAVNLLNSNDPRPLSPEHQWQLVFYSVKLGDEADLDSGTVEIHEIEYELKNSSHGKKCTKLTRCTVCCVDKEEGARGRIYENPPPFSIVRQTEVPMHVLTKPHLPHKDHRPLEYSDLEKAVRNFPPHTEYIKLMKRFKRGDRDVSFIHMQLISWRCSGPVDLIKGAKELPTPLHVARAKFYKDPGNSYRCSLKNKKPFQDGCPARGVLTTDPACPEQGYFYLTILHDHTLEYKGEDCTDDCAGCKLQEFPRILDPLAPEFIAAAAAAAAERAASRAARAAAREASEQQPSAKATRGTKRAAPVRGAGKAKKQALESSDSEGEAEPAAAARGERREPAAAARGERREPAAARGSKKREREESPGRVARDKRTRQSSRDGEGSSSEYDDAPADEMRSESVAAAAWSSRLRGRPASAQRYQESEGSEPEPQGSPEQKNRRPSRATSMRRGHPKGKENRAPPTSTHQSRPGGEGKMAALLEQVMQNPDLWRFVQEQMQKDQGQQQAGDEEEKPVPGPSTKTEPRRAALPSAAGLNPQDLPTLKPPVRRGGGVDEDEEMEEEPAAAQARAKKPRGEFVDNTRYLERVDLDSLLTGCGDGSGMATTSSKPTATVTATARSVEDAPVVMQQVPEPSTTRTSPKKADGTQQVPLHQPGSEEQRGAAGQLEDVFSWALAGQGVGDGGVSSATPFVQPRDVGKMMAGRGAPLFVVNHYHGPQASAGAIMSTPTRASGSGSSAKPTTPVTPVSRRPAIHHARSEPRQPRRQPLSQMETYVDLQHRELAFMENQSRLFTERGARLQQLMQPSEDAHAEQSTEEELEEQERMNLELCALRDDPLPRGLERRKSISTGNLAELMRKDKNIEVINVEEKEAGPGKAPLFTREEVDEMIRNVQQGLLNQANPVAQPGIVPPFAAQAAQPGPVLQPQAAPGAVRLPLQPAYKIDATGRRSQRVTVDGIRGALSDPIPGYPADVVEVFDDFDMVRYHGWLHRIVTHQYLRTPQVATYVPPNNLFMVKTAEATFVYLPGHGMLNAGPMPEGRILEIKGRDYQVRVDVLVAVAVP